MLRHRRRGPSHAGHAELDRVSPPPTVCLPGGLFLDAELRAGAVTVAGGVPSLRYRSLIGTCCWCGRLGSFGQARGRHRCCGVPRHRCRSCHRCVGTPWTIISFMRHLALYVLGVAARYLFDFVVTRSRYAWLTLSAVHPDLSSTGWRRKSLLLSRPVECCFQGVWCPFGGPKLPRSSLPLLSRTTGTCQFRRA